MSNSACIRLKTDDDMLNGLGIFVHYDAHPEFIQAALDYQRMLGFRSPSEDESGLARFVQILANYEEPSDRHGIYVGSNWRLPCPAYGYLIDGWKIVDEENWKVSEMVKECDLEECIAFIDMCQPFRLRLGKDMVHSLFVTNGTLKDLLVNYHYELRTRRDNAYERTPFVEHVTYNTYKTTIKIISRNEDTMIVEYADDIVEVPIYRWRDGTESTVVIDLEAKTKHPVMSTTPVDLASVKKPD